MSGSGKGSFENHFDDFSPSSAKHILNGTRDAISKKLYVALQNYKHDKLAYIITEPRKNIFHQDGTVYTGFTGLALFYLISSLEKNEGCEEILQKASQYVDLNNLKGKRISFLCGDAGPLAIATVISYKLGNRRPDTLPQYGNVAQSDVYILYAINMIEEAALPRHACISSAPIVSCTVENLISLLNDSSDELLYGKVGYLYALLFVNKHVNGIGKDLIPADHIEKIIASILKSGKEFAQKMNTNSPLLWQWHDKIYLGAAHGVAGILYMLLQARAYIDAKEVQDYIKPSVDWLLNQKFPSGNFPSSLGSASGDRLVQWCHGAPGFLPLCLLAFQVFMEEKYLKTAIECGDVVWQRGICTKGYSLCHGVSGNAYAFLQLYQATKNPQHLYRACCFMEWCMSERPGTELHSPDRPASLFEGLLGRIYLADDLMHPLQSKFPAFCL